MSIFSLGAQDIKGKDGVCPPQDQFLTQNIHEGLERTEAELQISPQKLIELKNAVESLWNLENV